MDFSHIISTVPRKTKSTFLGGPVVLIQRVLLPDSFLRSDCSIKREWTGLRMSIKRIEVVGLRLTLPPRTRQKENSSRLNATRELLVFGVLECGTLLEVWVFRILNFLDRKSHFCRT